MLKADKTNQDKQWHGFTWSIALGTIISTRIHKIKHIQSDTWPLPYYFEGCQIPEILVSQFVQLQPLIAPRLVFHLKNKMVLSKVNTTLGTRVLFIYVSQKRWVVVQRVPGIMSVLTNVTGLPDKRLVATHLAALCLQYLCLWLLLIWIFGNLLTKCLFGGEQRMPDATPMMWILD